LQITVLKGESMNQVEQSELLLRAAKRALTPEQQAAFDKLLASDATFREMWEQEKALTETLEALPQPSLSSNFTAQVLHSVELREQERRREARKHVNWIWSWPTRLATAGVAVLAVLIGMNHHNQNRRSDLAESLSTLSEITTALARNESDPGETAALLRDFDAIARLSNVPPEQEMDMELLLALQK
jgi:anti-sigma-K factor RskA